MPCYADAQYRRPNSSPAFTLIAYFGDALLIRKYLLDFEKSLDEHDILDLPSNQKFRRNETEERKDHYIGSSTVTSAFRLTHHDQRDDIRPEVS